ncbi:MAG: WbqC family protein [Bacteroidetes bacterium]|nr:WbqC family protein [Bacteroidota bacterium]
MTVAIMQPYFFPYIGYFQLINLADTFVIYDDCTFIKQGWINRNRILLNGKDFLISIPIKDLSSNALICNSFISNNIEWRDKMLKTISQAYTKSSEYPKVFPLIYDILNTKHDNLVDFIFSSLKVICEYLEIKTNFLISSSLNISKEVKSQNKVISICKELNANIYVNPIGGQELYSNSIFSSQNIELKFLKTNHISYNQFKNDFVPSLSIIDVLMFNSKSKILEMLNEFELIDN